MQNRDFDFSKLDTYKSNDKDFDFSHLDTHESIGKESKKEIDKDFLKQLIVGSSPGRQLEALTMGAGKGSENIATSLTGGRAPRVMEDISKMIGYEPRGIEKLFESTGQYAPVVTTPGGLLSQMLTGAGYGAIQEPESPISGAIGGAVLPASLKLAGKVLQGSPIRPALLKKVDFNKTISSVQNKHDLEKLSSEKKFTDVKNEAYSRGINNIPDIEKIIDKIDEGNYLPKSESFKKLLSNARTGDYQALRDLQSDLGDLGVSHKSSKFQAEKYKGIEMLELREKINDAIQKHFENTGHNDLANGLKEARKDYKNFMKTYYNVGTKTATPSTRSIAKMVDPNKRLIPKNPENVFSELSKPMEIFKEKHPEISEMLKLSKSKKSQIEMLKNLGFPVGVGVGGVTTYLLNKLLNKNQG